MRFPTDVASPAPAQKDFQSGDQLPVAAPRIHGRRLTTRRTEQQLLISCNSPFQRDARLTIRRIVLAAQFFREYQLSSHASIEMVVFYKREIGRPVLAASGTSANTAWSAPG